MTHFQVKRYVLLMMAQSRVILSKSYYHIIARGNNHQTLFHDQDDFNYYLDLIQKYKTEHPFQLFHYCLMSNHVHLLVQVDHAKSFIAFMRKIQLAYFYYYKAHYAWDGHLWQGRYKNQAVGKDAYFIQCGKYIELNPVRAKIVTRPEEYSYTSYRHYVQGEPNRLISDDPFYTEMGKDPTERRAKYQKLIVGEDVMAEPEKRKRSLSL